MKDDLQIAIHCQICIGSYTNSPDTCKCESIKDCIFTEKEIKKLSKIPEVKFAEERNYQHYKSIYGTPQ